MGRPVWILNRFGVVENILVNRAGGAKAYWNDQHVETLLGELSYDFECPADEDVSEHVITENLVLWRDLDDSKRLARIKLVTEDVGSDGKLIKIVHAEGTQGDLNGHLLESDVAFEGETASSIISTLLATCEWSVGTIEYNGLLKMAFSQGDTVLACVRAVIAESGLEYRFRVEFDEASGRITGKYVDGLTRIGRFTGERFSLGRNIKGFTRTTDSSELATACLPLGATGDDGSRIDVAGIAWHTEDGANGVPAGHYYNKPADKPMGQMTIGDPDARDAYGHGEHITRPFDDTGETSPEKLADKAWRWLMTVNSPSTAYQMNAPLLDSLPKNAARRLNLGDSVIVDVKKMRPPVSAEVRSNGIQRSYTDPTGAGFSARRGSQ